jgi:hypothetical protein
VPLRQSYLIGLCSTHHTLLIDLLISDVSKSQRACRRLLSSGHLLALLLTSPRKVQEARVAYVCAFAGAQQGGV